jgi:hypothetical protein
MSGHRYYQARVCTGDHRRFGNLPKYAAKVVVELPAREMERVIPVIVKIAANCFERHFQLNSFVRRATETDQIIAIFPPDERTGKCDYQDEDGRAWIVQDLSEKHARRHDSAHRGD